MRRTHALGIPADPSDWRKIAEVRKTPAAQLRLPRLSSLQDTPGGLQESNIPGCTRRYRTHRAITVSSVRDGRLRGIFHAFNPCWRLSCLYICPVSQAADVQTNAAETQVQTCGVVGAGSIGAAIAQRLASVGANVCAYDIDAPRVRALQVAGVSASDTPRQLAQRSQVVILTLPNTPQIEACLQGQDGLEAGLSPGSFVLLMSTVDPEAARALSERLHKRGVEMLDTPVSGGPVAARAGELTIMVGAEEQAFARCQPLLELLGSHVVHVGPVGDGETAKLVNNLMGAVIVLGIAEGLALAAKAGLDVERTRRAISGGSGASWILQEWLPRTILSDPSQTHFAVELMCKDMGLVRDLAESMEVPLEAGALARQTFERLRDAGDGGRDFSILLARTAEAIGANLTSG